MLDLTNPPIIVASLSSNLRENVWKAKEEGADAVEVRLDLYDGEIVDLEDCSSLPVIATYRPEYEGGEYDGSEDKRIEELKRATEFDCVEAVDIELDASSEDIETVTETADREDVSVIVSHHDFEGTPSKKEMNKILERANDVGDIAKLAVTANSRRDVLQILEVTLSFDGSVCTIAMGSTGSHSRVVAPLYGSVMTYANLTESRRTAPGQLSVTEVRTALRILSYQYS